MNLCRQWFNSFTGFLCTTSGSPLDTNSALIGGDQDRRDELVEPLSTAGKNNRISKNGSFTIGTLTIPAGYDKLVLPLGNVSPSIFVNVELGIREVLGVDTKGEVNKFSYRFKKCIQNVYKNCM